MGVLNSSIGLRQAPGSSARSSRASVASQPAVSRKSICWGICKPDQTAATAATGRLRASQPYPSSFPSQQHHERHLRTVPAAASADASADEAEQQQQQHNSPNPIEAAAAASQHASSGSHVDDLAGDDNVILLLGSEDEDDVDDGEGAVVLIDEDFAASMAAARQQVLSGSSSDEDVDGGGWNSSEEWDTPYSEDFWSTEKERVYLVGATYKQQYQMQQQHRQQQQQQHRSNTRQRSLFNLSGDGSSSSSRGFAPPAVGDLAPGGSSSGSSRRRQGRGVSYSVEESLEELGRLAETAGLQVIGSSYQVLESPNPATYIGSGKVAEVAAAVQAAKADTVVFDDELSPGQLRNLEKAFSGGQGGKQVAVADRTALILDIFNQRAQTREGKLQVELAQTEYQLPRLTRMWTHLDRVAGGGQVKGVGEKQIEIDKRLLRDKAAALRRELEAVRTHRAAHRTRRQDAPIPVVALVGYTNAGKSTLLNTLTAAGVLAEDKLFATLDPTTRKVRLSGNLEVLFSDTVGFIQKLPTQLVAAFRATLEEIAAASVVVHVLDASAPNAAAQCSAVLQVLDEIGVQDLPMITAWNKVDACDNADAVLALAASRPDVVAVSGATGEGLDRLLELVALKLAENMVGMEVLLPYSQGALLDELHKMGKVSDTQYTEAGTLVAASVPRCLVGKLQQYATAAAAASAWGAGAAVHEEELSEGLKVVHVEDEDDGWQQQHEQHEQHFSDLALSQSGSSSSSMSTL